MTIYEIVLKLAGPIQPVGDSNEDARRLENLSRLTEAIEGLLFEIGLASESADRPEASMSAIGKCASEFLQEVRDA